MTMKLNPKATYSSHLVIPVLGKSYEIQKYSNFTISTGLIGKPDLIYNQDVYLMDSQLPPHQHFVRDLLGQYFVVSSQFKDVSVFMLDQKGLSYESATKDTYRTVLEAECHLSPDRYASLEDYSNIQFKSVIYITNDSVPILESTLGSFSINSPELLTKSTEILLDSCRELNDKLAAYKSDQAPDKKIFISRKKEDKMAEDIIDSYYDYLKLGLEGVTINKKLMEDVDKSIRDTFCNPEKQPYIPGGEQYNLSLGEIFKYVAERLLVETYHDELEQFFLSQGYEIIDGSDYRLSEQIELFSRASSVAGVSGGGLVNAIFCNPDTKIYALAPTNTFYSGGHDHTLSRLFGDFHVIPGTPRNWEAMEPNKKYSASQIIQAFSDTVTTRDP